MAPTDKNDENDTWTFEGGVAIEDADNGFKKLGWLTKDNKAISTITVDEAGDYLLAVYYLNDDTTYDSPRILKVTVNGEENYFQPVKTDTWGDTTRAVAAYLKVTLTEGENTIVISGGQGGIYKEGDGRTDAPPFIKYILTAYEN